MSKRVSMLAAASCCTALAAFAQPAALAQDYDVFQLPLPPSWTSIFPLSINDNGHAVGINTDGFWQMPRGFYFDGTTSVEFGTDLIESLPYPSWMVGVRPTQINNSNHVLFQLEILDVGVFSYIWDGTTYSEIAPTIPPGIWDYADAGAGSINNLGQVCGAMRFIINDPPTLWYRAFVWDPATDTTTIIDPPAPFDISTAAHLSDTGYVTGHVFGGPEVASGFLWKDGVVTLFQGIDKNDYLSISQRVNDSGFAGAFTTNFPPPGTPSLSRVFLWSEAGIHHWSYPTGNLTGFQVYGITNDNQLVGTMMGPQQPFHFHNGVLRNLNDHITSPQKGVTLDLWDAYDINNHGQIVTHGQFIFPSTGHASADETGNDPSNHKEEVLSKVVFS